MPSFIVMMDSTFESRPILRLESRPQRKKLPIWGETSRMRSETAPTQTSTGGTRQWYTLWTETSTGNDWINWQLYNLCWKLSVPVLYTLCWYDNWQWTQTVLHSRVSLAQDGSRRWEQGWLCHPGDLDHVQWTLFTTLSPSWILISMIIPNLFLRICLLEFLLLFLSIWILLIFSINAQLI